jgi:hypothetical protein
VRRRRVKGCSGCLVPKPMTDRDRREHVTDWQTTKMAGPE